MKYEFYSIKFCILAGNLNAFKIVGDSFLDDFIKYNGL